MTSYDVALQQSGQLSFIELLILHHRCFLKAPISIPFFSLVGYPGPPLKPTQRCFGHRGRLQASGGKYSVVLLFAWSPRRAPSSLTGRTPRRRIDSTTSTRRRNERSSSWVKNGGRRGGAGRPWRRRSRRATPASLVLPGTQPPGVPRPVRDPIRRSRLPRPRLLHRPL